VKASGTPPVGGSGKIKKSIFGFKGGRKNFLSPAAFAFNES
jgi:hypothetical protein